ncbi:hypothetical protein AAVH_41440, partial [Aphelenchoides avenae]
AHAKRGEYVDIETPVNSDDESDDDKSDWSDGLDENMNSAPDSSAPSAAADDLDNGMSRFSFNAQNL